MSRVGGGVKVVERSVARMEERGEEREVKGEVQREGEVEREEESAQPRTTLTLLQLTLNRLCSVMTPTIAASLSSHVITTDPVATPLGDAPAKPANASTATDMAATVKVMPCTTVRRVQSVTAVGTCSSGTNSSCTGL